MTPGDFDIVSIQLGGWRFPAIRAAADLRFQRHSNFGKIGNAQIDAKINQTLSELDPAKARALANEVDTMLWQEGFSLPLYQSPGNRAVRSSLANYGSPGLADVD